MEENNIPTHVAIIMDGNRRWARKRNIDYRLGHKEGAKTLEKIVRYAKKAGIKYITVYAFSTENWKRTSEEVSALMLLLKTYLDDYGKRADTENIKVKVLGDITALTPGLQKSIKKCEERTKDNDGIYFSICINYGGRDEIVHAVKNIAQDVKIVPFENKHLAFDCLKNTHKITAKYSTGTNNTYVSKTPKHVNINNKIQNFIDISFFI